ncbi:hypothetical protein [Vibrio owensii]|uniref:hypothetical protein n=1 Tax=Vibrio owensii TaxID=696485 RepID=UPI00221FED03|nr:hypothetical protein [Vibrio owensii]
MITSKYKLHFFSFLLISANLALHETIYAVILTLPQAMFMLYLMAKQRDYEKILFFHFLFVFTTLAVPYSQLTSPGDSEGGLYNYSRLKLIGPLALSQLMMILVLMYGILKRGRITFLAEQKPLVYLLSFFFIVGTIFSLYGFAFDDYSFQKMLTYFVYISVLILTIVLVCMSKSYNELIRLSYVLLVVAPIASVFVYLIGFSTVYGSSSIPGMIEVAYFSPILIYKQIRYKNWNFLEIVSIICCFILAATGATGGKGIIIIAFTIMVSFLSQVSLKTLFIIMTIPILMFGMSQFVSYDDIHSFNGLLLYKLESVWLLLKFVFNFDMSIINIMPMSPRVRVIEFYLIMQKNSQDIVSFLFGQGYGGWYEDIYGYFSGMDLSSAFSESELNSGRYHSAHDFFAVLPLLHGFSGMLFMGLLVVYYLKRIKCKYTYLAVFPFLLSIYFNNQYGSFAVFLILISCTPSFYRLHEIKK